MAGFMSSLWGRKDTQQVSRDAIVNLRQQLQMIEKKEEYTLKKVEEELAKAKANAVTNKTASLAALKRKKMLESELEKLQGTKFQLEMNVNTLESAKMNQETMSAMKKAADALKHIHGNLTIDKVDKTMSEIQEQTQLAVEIQDQISSGPIGADLDEDELKKELEGLEQDQLNDMLKGAEPAPIHLPQGVTKPTEVKDTAEMDEDAMLKQLQAELAM